jgi:hypothetical protein
LITQSHHLSPSNRRWSPEVWGPELTSDFHDAPIVSNPLAQHRVEVGELEVAHSKRTWIASTSSGVIVHVHGNKLVVYRSKPIPRMETGDALKRRYFLANLDLH